MVNLQTGDFTYNIPLLEVPGPSGGYPLSLSYHAGIMPGEEASWVGLGWTLNPGAINRTVNGFADDHKDVTNTNRFFWEGGERTSVEVGYTLGIAGVGGATVGLAVGHDTYQGFGVGGFVGFGVSLGQKDSPLSAGGRVGVDPWGNPYASAGLSVGTGKTESTGMQLSGSVGISTNFKSVSGYSGVGVSYDYGKGKGSSNMMGASISSGSGGAASLSVVGASNVGNSKTGKISTSGISFTLPIPFLHLGFRNQRYWIDEIENTATNGSLYYPTYERTDWHYYDDKAYDTYSLLDPSESGGIVDNPDPDKVLGGSFPSYDHYSINAQGISGNIQPYIFKGYLHRQNSKDDDRYNTIHYSNGVHSNQLGFRFIGDFSNRFLFDPPSFTNGSDLLNFDFNDAASEVTGDGELAGMIDGKLAGSKNIEYFTNYEIKFNNARLKSVGFIDTNSSGFNRNGTSNHQIGAYVVTNESGVKYHFSLPVYASEEYQYSEKITGVTTFNEIIKPKEYAYTWLLTGITGPDFVDRGVIGEFDEEDWGYWVEFDYGKWTEDYVWRNPDLGTHKDLDTNFENFSTGIKEVYYLDQIKTKTHTAVFVKDIRDDAKSAIRHFKNKYGTPTTDDEKEGSYKPKIINTKISPRTFDNDAISIDTRSLPVSSLKLKEVYLFKNEDLFGLDKTVGSQLGQQMTYDWSLVSNSITGERVVKQHLPDNVLDAYDLTDAVGKKAIRVIAIGNTNKPDEGALCPETINSYPTSLINSSPVTIPLQGKLTLQHISFKGKGGADLIPPVKFNYELEEPIYGQGKIEREGATSYLMETQSGLQKGDIIKLSEGAVNYYALIQDDLGIKLKLKILGRNQFADQVQVSWKQTKNPPYDGEAHDIWGMYKSNYYEHGKNENLARFTSKISSESVDSWSLCSIKTSYGNEVRVEYEHDEYIKPELYNQSLLTVDKIELGSDPNILKIFIYEDISNYKDLLEELSLNVTFLMKNKEYSKPLYPTECIMYTWVKDVFEVNNYLIENSNILSVYNDHLEINNEELFELLSGEGERLLELYTDVANCNNYNSTETVFMGIYEYEKNEIVQGNIFTSNNTSTLGGGLRTKKISILDRVKNIKSNTNYQYEKGVTSFEPTDLGVIDLTKLLALKNAASGHMDVYENAEKEFKKAVYKNFDFLLTNSREIPAPGVMYGRVTVHESFTNGEGKESFAPTYSTYEFQTFEDYMVDFDYQPFPDEDVTLERLYHDPISWTDKVRQRRITISDLTAQVGTLKSISRYENTDGDNEKSNDPLMAKTINHYLSDTYTTLFDNRDVIVGDGKGGSINPYKTLSDKIESQFSSQGMIQESYVDARYVRQEDYTIEVRDYDVDVGSYQNRDVHPYHLLGVISKKERYPLIQTGQTSINYKTGVTTRTSNLGFDFYSGAVTKTLTNDGYGNVFLSEIIPAYRKYGGVGGMGLAIHRGKNMLTQEAANYTYKVSSESDLTKEALVSASIQTWANQVKNITANSKAASIVNQYNSSEQTYTPVLKADKGFCFNGQILEFNTGGNIYNLELGDWSDNLLGFEILDLDGIDFESNDNHTGIAKLLSSDSWRKHKGFNYTAGQSNLKIANEGLIAYTSEDHPPFYSWNTDDSRDNELWQKTSEITLYDRYSHALEATDVNGNFAATKMDSKQEKVLAIVANASYSEFAYSGAEDEVVNGYFGGTVSQGDATLYTASDDDDENVHTGEMSLSASPGSKVFRFEASLTQSRNTKVSVWSTQNDGLIKYRVNEGEEQILTPKVRQAGNWYLLSAHVPSQSPGDQLKIWCEVGGSTAYFDDFRVHPIDAPMTAYVYNSYDELTFVLDNNNLYTEYEYDDMGRLSSTYRESFKYGRKKVSQYDIAYSVSAKK
ncbi:hypothetical protein N7E81_01590 [Reichenbachiella carrageenanivorans]|uniref:RHS repeat-associated core domain-containing protein n=1 Tax=Reichenbachiella carrageenanivorans TaxID=2979869 RepID=A0ABY6D0U5_9BACT|nr:hypothetical protein [Reichenbachiella carrageenanivorans]UXX79799.1 hypothetical protein N7E81_01590 [Reichenbachiella carrageenanivorans]